MGTIFENTKINLVKWFMAMCLISSSNKKGVSSHQLSRDLNITQKTAWFILHKVHALFAQDDAVALEGEASWMKCISAAWRPTSTSPRKPQILMGAPSRPRLPYSAWLPAGGFAHAFMAKDVKSKTLKPYISAVLCGQCSPVHR